MRRKRNVRRKRTIKKKTRGKKGSSEQTLLVSKKSYLLLDKAVKMLWKAAEYADKSFAEEIKFAKRQKKRR